MSNLRQAAQQAIEALAGVAQWVEKRPDTHPWDAWQRIDPAITALRAALAEPEQEPVAHSVVEPLRPDEYQCRVSVKWVGQPVSGPLYTAPTPRRPLTDEEINAALVSTDPETKRLPPGFRDFARAIERAHGIVE